MKFTKIIFIRYMPLTEKIYNDFYMKDVHAANIKVEYWDITALFFNGLTDIEDSSGLVTTKKYDSYGELETALYKEDLSQTLFISIMSYEGRVVKLYKLLTKYNCILGVFGRNMLPLPKLEKKYYFKLLFDYKFVFRYLNNRRAIKMKQSGKIKGYDYIFTGGDMGWLGVGYIDTNEVSKAKIVKINSDDYDEAIKLNDIQAIEDNYILFLDEYLPFHPDTKLFNIKTVTAEEYYPELCSFFDRVEAQYGVPVIIAAHPKAIRYKENDYFNGRKIYFGKSAQLSRHANFVIAHDSTSINFAISYDVKLHLITSKNIQKNIGIVHNDVVHFANYLKCNYQWFDREVEPINLVEILPKEGYDLYKYQYLTSKETESIQTKDIFLNFLLNEGSV